jgi:AcrR family transcriptional regulator
MIATRKEKRSTRRRALVRGEPIVRNILSATLKELGRRGYGALRIDDVAHRAGVNKTTVYRRWPTREDLVRAALLSIAADRFVVPNTGELRSDLMAIARATVEMALSIEDQSLMRVFLAEGPDSELFSLARSLRKAQEMVPRYVIEAAKRRHELADNIDATLLFDVLSAALHKRLFTDREEVNEAFISQLVDLLLLGALAPEQRGASQNTQRTTAPLVQGRAARH